MKTEKPADRMTDPDRASAPLASSLLHFAESRRQSWHIPGHDGGSLWPDWLKDHLSAMDVTELPLTDDLNRPEGPARLAMEWAASAFGAGVTRFITTGSTTALYIMLAFAVGRQGTLLVSRCCHQSVVHAAALLDLDLRYLPATGFPAPDQNAVLMSDSLASRTPVRRNPAYPDKMNPPPRLTLLPLNKIQDVERALKLNPGCKAILLTAPDYYGGCADLQEIARLAHAAGVLVLVDEAHGAHLSFCPELLPGSAMAAGADACVQSGHKTLPVLTQGAYLHLSARAISAGLLDQADLDRLIPVFQTSSPSFPIAATLDFTRAFLAMHGDRLVREQKKQHDLFAEALPPELTCQPWPLNPSASRQMLDGRSDLATRLSRDPMRLILTTSDPDQACLIRRLAECLTAAGIDIEFSDLTRLVLIPSLGQPQEKWKKLADVLRRSMPKAIFSATQAGSGSISIAAMSARLFALEDEWRRWLADRPEKVLAPGDALFGSGSSGAGHIFPAAARTKPTSGRSLQWLPLGKSAGHIAAAAISPYPPGIPLIWPGERLDQDRVDFLRKLLENKTSISGIVQEKLLVLA